MTSYSAGLAAIAMRRKKIVEQLKKCGAVSEETAVTLADAGIFNPNAFHGIADRLVAEKLIRATSDGRYYIPQGQNSK